MRDLLVGRSHARVANSVSLALGERIESSLPGLESAKKDVVGRSHAYLVEHVPVLQSKAWWAPILGAIAFEFPPVVRIDELR